ncbi:hypothetical protein [Microbacterium aerolatum]|uniref:Fe-S oxidoreductase n=1 Tax=Microbacterium aerolatum TaxID=153731 RepID=A0A511AF69_9MICO|nr:hypothetical protein [Microbacterium aerolatum]GEK86790.1 hypothetical protein MAE01_19660 [Microbacterium aerolatum]GGB25059.1 hypothetical protein GCM10007198_14290 [Microbacterium aerolatum]
MQLGTRWAAGSDAPASVPAALLPAIGEVEARLASAAEPVEAHWTLTWLEGRPIAELDAGWEVLLTASGEVIARPFED